METFDEDQAEPGKSLKQLHILHLITLITFLPYLEIALHLNRATISFQAIE